MFQSNNYGSKSASILVSPSLPKLKAYYISVNPSSQKVSHIYSLPPYLSMNISVWLKVSANISHHAEKSPPPPLYYRLLLPWTKPILTSQWSLALARHYQESQSLLLLIYSWLSENTF